MVDLVESAKRRFHEAGIEKEAILEKIAADNAEFQKLREEANRLEARAKEIFEQKLRGPRERIYELDVEVGKIAKFLRVGLKSVTGTREDFFSADQVKAIKAKV